MVENKYNFRTITRTILCKSNAKKPYFIRGGVKLHYEEIVKIMNFYVRKYWEIT